MTSDCVPSLPSRVSGVNPLIKRKICHNIFFPARPLICGKCLPPKVLGVEYVRERHDCGEGESAESCENCLYHHESRTILSPFPAVSVQV